MHIGQSPYEVPDHFARATARWPQRAIRAKEALAWLGDTPRGRDEWSKIAERNQAVPTVLRKLGPDQTARLLWHAYVIAACNLHVLLDGFPLPATLPSQGEFRDLIGQP